MDRWMCTVSLSAALLQRRSSLRVQSPQAPPPSTSIGPMNVNQRVTTQRNKYVLPVSVFVPFSLFLLLSNKYIVRNTTAS